MTLEQRDLWLRIQSFKFNPEGATKTFEARLAKDQGWSLEFAHLVVEEYRKFVFLTMTAGHPCTPSESIDEVWHLHLIYSRSYWEDLCGQVLGKPLHHEPSYGLPGQAKGHRDGFHETLASYRNAFGTEPPADIWMAKKPAPAVASVEKPKRSRVRLWAGLALAGTVVAGCATAEVGNARSDITPMLVIFGIFAVVVIVIIAAARAARRRAMGPTYYQETTYISDCNAPPVIIEQPVYIEQPSFIEQVIVAEVAADIAMDIVDSVVDSPSCSSSSCSSSSCSSSSCSSNSCSS